MSRIERAWRSRGVLACMLWPVSMMYRLLMALRRKAYSSGGIEVSNSPLPVIVVGNLSVGGTGKTPLCAHLVGVFQQAGWRPGVVSRGYGGARHTQPHRIQTTDTPDHVGDEPLMLFQQTGVPVCVCTRRASAVEHLHIHSDVNIVFADDGLQHLAMARCAEIVVVDGTRGFGNGWMLPAGPLREPAARLTQADLVAVQASGSFLHDSLSASVLSGAQQQLASNTFTVNLSEAVELTSGRRKPLSEFMGQPLTAMAGIGHPERFFKALKQKGLQITGIALPDHHHFSIDDLDAADPTPILVTSKDAVKLRALGALPFAVYEVPATLGISDALHEQIMRLEQSLRLASQREL